MLRLPNESARLSTAERYALAILADASRVLVAADAVVAVELRVADEAPHAATLDQLRATGWQITAGDGEVLIGRALLAAIVDIVGSAAEHRTQGRDRFGRV